MCFYISRTTEQRKTVNLLLQSYRGNLVSGVDISVVEAPGSLTQLFLHMAGEFPSAP
jgi:hypothetical protein